MQPLMRLLFVPLFVPLVVACTSGLAAETTAPAKVALPEKIEFNRDIRPILSDHCFACHGPDAKHREADLRVDTELGLLGADGKSGAVTRGDVMASPLWHRVTSAEADEQMPPPKFGKPLSPQQVALLKRWIEQGAPWQGHWAFQPLQATAPPSGANEPSADVADFVLNEIDAFTLPAMLARGLAPSPVADRRGLVRRLSFDLLGLPPTYEQVQRLESDRSPMSYENLVDDLLASPHFGERMAMWWLDLVRYADSVGYHGDQPVSVSPFRDYVIRSFNQNRPFDQFTREQLAGDLLPEPSIEQRIASGYNRLGMMSAEGGVQPKEYLAKYIAERVRNLSGTWLGVTLGCCECHDHKYDPFSTKEFYQLEAFFADIEEQGLYAGSKFGYEMPVPNADEAAKQRELELQIALVQQELETPTAALASAQQLWEQSQPEWHSPTPTNMTSAGRASLSRQEDGSILVSGELPETDTYTITYEHLPADISAIRLEVLPHPSLPQQGPGRAGNGNFVLTELRAETQSLESADGAPLASPKPISLRNASATYEQTGAAKGNPYGKWAVAAAIDNDSKGKKWGWAVMEQAGQANLAIFETAERIGGTGQRLVLQLEQAHDNPKHTLGRFRITFTSAAPPITAQASLSTELAQVIKLAPNVRTDDQAHRLASHFRSVTPLLAEARDRLASLKKQLDEHQKTLTTTLATRMVPPRMIRVLNRGNWMDENGQVVEPAFPEVLGGTPQLGRRLNRLDLANWVVAADNPLTARVTVNRLWKLFFGTGLSARLDDLGSQGQWPTHPELLDWLANRFVDSGWNLKQLVKLMVMSNTYRQSSFAGENRAELDPGNQWLSRQTRFRLDAEMIRDNALAVSGLLVDDVGGKSVNPYQPPGYWAYLNFPQREWANGKADQLYRRGVYTHWQRQYLHPSLLAFDAPSREECTADRPRSNTPLQALVLLNDPIYIEAARCLAERALTEVVADDVTRIAWIIQNSLHRQPRPAESEVLSQLLASHRAQYREDQESAKRLIAIGDKPADKNLDQVELAAWTSVTRAILNLHEFITRN